MRAVAAEANKDYVLCEVSWSSGGDINGVEFFARVHSRLTASASAAKQTLKAVTAARRYGAPKLQLLRAEKLSRYTLLAPSCAADGEGIRGPSCCCTTAHDDGASPSRLALAAASTDDYFNLRANSTFPSLSASDMPRVLHAFTASDAHTQLGLTGNTELGGEGAALIADALGRDGVFGPKRVSGLYLSCCGFGGRAGAIAEALLQPEGLARGLTRLGLNHNQIGPAAVCEQIAPMLAGSALSSLQVLGLTGNGVGDVGAAALSSALSSNHTLHRLFLSSNEITCSGAEAVAQLMRTSRTMRRVG